MRCAWGMRMCCRRPLLSAHCQYNLRLEQILDDCALTYKHIKLGMPALCCFDWLDHVGSERVTLQLLITTCIVTQQQVIATALSGHNLLMQAVSSNQDHLAGSVASSLQCKECICSVPMKQMTLTFVYRWTDIVGQQFEGYKLARTLPKSFNLHSMAWWQGSMYRHQYLIQLQSIINDSLWMSRSV